MQYYHFEINNSNIFIHFTLKLQHKNTRFCLILLFHRYLLYSRILFKLELSITNLKFIYLPDTVDKTFLHFMVKQFLYTEE